jgi:PTS system fructose-specific IIA component/PTS system nitrogen regulatory IIA component
MIPSSAILAPLRASDRDAAVQELVDGLIAAGAVPGALREELIGKLLAREKVHSTGFGRGVAVPHAKHPGLTRLTAAVGLSVQGLEFASLDKQPVYTVILLLSPEGRPDEHLQAMEAIFKNLTKDSFRRALRQAQTPADVRAVLQGADGQTLAG